MRIPKKPPEAPKPAQTGRTESVVEDGEVEADGELDAETDDKPALDALVDEVAGPHASAARLKTIVERVLGGGDDSRVHALVKKLAQVERPDTAPGYDLPATSKKRDD